MKPGNLEQKISEAGRHLETNWSESRRDAVLEKLTRRRRNRSIARIAAASVCALAVAATAVALFHERMPQNASVSQEGISEVRLADGSKVDLLSAKTRINAEMDGNTGRTRVVLSSGNARFDVVHNPARLFTVEAGPIIVEVIGTRFLVERFEGRVRVSVERGRVRIERKDDSIELGAGDTATFPEHVDGTRGGADPDLEQIRKEGKPGESPGLNTGDPVVASAVAHPSRPGRNEPAAPPGKTWKSFAVEGRFEQAYALMQNLSDRDLPDDPGDLLLMADVSRLTSHPKDAKAPLGKLIRRNPSDPRTPLAAFTLGRVMLDDLGDPRGAAEAFRRARELAPEGPMAEDALAREVEAHWRAGDAALARERAEEYVKKYPDGRRIGPVKHYGDLD